MNTDSIIAMHSVSDQMHRRVRVPKHPQRIISLVPSQTELLHDLGLGDRVIGITKFCVHPNEWFRGKPRVGGTKKLHLDKIRELKPDLIIGNKEENDEAQINMLVHEFPVCISDVRDLPSALDMVRSVGELVGTSKKAQEIATGIQEGFDGITTTRPELRALYLIWRNPWMAAGSDTFIADMMRRGGLTNLAVEMPDRYPELTAEKLVELDPEVVLLSSEPYPFKQAHTEEVTTHLPNARIELVDGELFSWYGSRLLRTPGYLQQLRAKLMN